MQNIVYFVEEKHKCTNNIPIDCLWTMYTLCICGIWLSVLYVQSVLFERIQQGQNFRQAEACRSDNIDKTTSSYSPPVGTTTDSVYKLRNLDQMYDGILTTLANPKATPNPAIKVTNNASPVIISGSAITLSGSSYKKASVSEIIGKQFNKDTICTYACNRTKITNEIWSQSPRLEEILTSSVESISSTVLRIDDMPSFGGGDHARLQENDYAYSELCTGCSGVDTATLSHSEMVASSSHNQDAEATLTMDHKNLKPTSIVTKLELTKTRPSSSDTNYITTSFIINTSTASAITKSESQLNLITSFVNHQKRIYSHRKNNDYYNKSKKYKYSIHRMKMTLQSENSTIFYTGNHVDSPFHGRGRIVLKDKAFNEMNIWFFIQIVEKNGNAYTNEVNGEESEINSIKCWVQHLSEEIVYIGWHRWEYDPSEGTSLTCDGGTVPLSSHSSVIYTNYPLWFDSELNDAQFTEMFDLQPSISGLYVCIAVDSKFNVIVTNYLDIRMIRVVTSNDSYITPEQVTIYENDTHRSFVHGNCKGYSRPDTNGISFRARVVQISYLDNITQENESFTVSELHCMTWITAKSMFENIDLSRPMLIRCHFMTEQWGDLKYMDMYFRHDSVKHRKQNTFTAVSGEILTFFCSDEIYTVTSACYFEGNCSDNVPTHICSNSSNLTVTINKQLCFLCSSNFSQINLQIIVEDDFRTINEKYQQVRNDCNVLSETHKGLYKVKSSNLCEENAIELVNENKYQNRTLTFMPYTYMAYYTTRQFIVCQGQPIKWSVVELSPNVFNVREDTVVLKVTICIFAVTILLLIILAWKRRRDRRTRQNRQVQLENIVVPHFRTLANNSLLEKDKIPVELEVMYPKENFKRSRISLGSLIGTGKFGQVYQASVKGTRDCEEFLEVAVKELKRHACKSENSSVRINKEIEIMRLITPHLNIIRYYGFSVSTDSNLLIMELVKGPSLLEYLREQRTRVPGFVIRMNFCSDSAHTTQPCLCCKMCDPSYVNVCISERCIKPNNGIGNSDCGQDKSLDADFNQCIDDSSDASESVQDQWSIESDNTQRKKYAENNYFCEVGYRKAVENMTKEIFSICRQVARGMSHLASFGIIHCDLAARNVIVKMSNYPLVVKICDFGMAQNLPEGEFIYKGDSKGPRPFRWMSPEALNKGEFSVFSDVWSYGILCWEVVTLGLTPYGKMPNLATVAKVASGQHLPRPSNCDTEIFSVLKSCWKMKPDERPSFKNLVEKWSDILEANSDYLELRPDEDDEVQISKF